MERPALALVGGEGGDATNEDSFCVLMAPPFGLEGGEPSLILVDRRAVGLSAVDRPVLLDDTFCWIFARCYQEQPPRPWYRYLYGMSPRSMMMDEAAPPALPLREWPSELSELILRHSRALTSKMYSKNELVALREYIISPALPDDADRSSS